VTDIPDPLQASTQAAATSPGFSPDQLRGFRIGVTSDRRSEDLLAAFERRGAETVHAPTIRMTDASDDDAVIAETHAVIASRPDYVLATTSYGMRRWFETADAAGIGEDLLEVLGHARILVRGPKARGAVRAAGLEDHGMSERETTMSLVDLVLRNDIRGATIAIQLHGFTDPVQLRRLEAAGARVLTAAPYRWTAHEDSARVLRLIDAICSGGVDAVTFTSAPAVEALFTVASAAGRLEPLQAAFRDTVVAAAVGPVTAAPLVEAGVLPIVPDRFRMGALIRIVCEHLEHGVLRLETVAGPVELRGRLVTLDALSATLSPVALSLFRTLMLAGGWTVSRDALAQSAPVALDGHAVDVAMSRLRQALPDGRIVATVIKRGYRIATAAEPR
jgi:uroporphyrinogen-III synthase